MRRRLEVEGEQGVVRLPGISLKFSVEMRKGSFVAKLCSDVGNVAGTLSKKVLVIRGFVIILFFRETPAKVVGLVVRVRNVG